MSRTRSERFCSSGKSGTLYPRIDGHQRGRLWSVTAAWRWKPISKGCPISAHSCLPLWGWKLFRGKRTMLMNFWMFKAVHGWRWNCGRWNWWRTCGSSWMRRRMLISHFLCLEENFFLEEAGIKKASWRQKMINVMLLLT